MSIIRPRPTTAPTLDRKLSARAHHQIVPAQVSIPGIPADTFPLIGTEMNYKTLTFHKFGFQRIIKAHSNEWKSFHLTPGLRPPHRHPSLRSDRNKSFSCVLEQLFGREHHLALANLDSGQLTGIAS